MSRVISASLVLLGVMKPVYVLGKEGAIGSAPGSYKVVYNAGERASLEITAASEGVKFASLRSNFYVHLITFLGLLLFEGFVCFPVHSLTSLCIES